MHWRNSDFQIRHFLAGKCHTADEAYRVLMELREERDTALEHARFAGRKLVLRRSWMCSLEWIPFIGPWARIELDRMDAEQPRIQKLVDACVHEINTINECLVEIAPHRKFSELPDAIAHQASQEAEWLAELKWRAENYLLTGSIPCDQLETMRLHPSFSKVIWPHIQGVRVVLRKGDKLPMPEGTAMSRLLENKHANPE